MTAVLKEELKHWLKRLEMDEAVDPERYRNSGMLLRLPNGLAVEPILIRKKFIKWQDEHPEFTRIVFHGLRHSSATYQLIDLRRRRESRAGQQRATPPPASAGRHLRTHRRSGLPRRSWAEKLEAGFYSSREQRLPQSGSAPVEAESAGQHPDHPVTALLEAIRQMNAEPRP